MENTYHIPEENLAALTADLEALNRRAAKLGVPGLTIQTGEPTEEEYTPRDPHTGSKRRDPITGEPVVLVRLRYPVTVSGEMPVLDGWEFVATLVLEDGGVIVRSAPGQECPPEYREETTATTCDHCNARRRRLSTYVVRHQESGEYKRVGSTCVQDFLGGKDPHKLADLAERVMVFLGNLQDPDEMWTGGNVEPRWNLRRLLEVTSLVMRLHGWTSKGQVYDQGWGVATATQVVTYLWPGCDADRKFIRETGATTDVDAAAAEAALAWAEEDLLGQDNLNDYQHNLAVIVRTGSARIKDMGLACSLLRAHQRVLEGERRQEAEARRQEEAKPAPEGREEVQGVILRTDIKANGYGERLVMTFLADDGWKAWGTVPSGPEVQEGDRVSFRATFQPKREDPTFAFFKRPTNLERLEEVAG